LIEDIFKPPKSHFPHLNSQRIGGIGRKTPQYIVLFGTQLPQDMGVGKEQELLSFL
jgi:hypothetical protein